MSLLPFLIVCLIAGTLSLLAWQLPRLSLAIGLVGLFAGFLAASGIRSDDALRIAGGVVDGSSYTRLFLSMGCLAGFMLSGLTLVSGRQPALAGTWLIALAALGLGLSLDAPGAALEAATLGSLVAIVATVQRSSSESGIVALAAELRAAALAGAVGLAAIALVTDADAAGRLDPGLVGLAMLAGAVAVAIRLASIPFHRWAAKAADASPALGLPLAMAWSAAAFTLVALGWAVSTAPGSVGSLGVERAVIVAVAAATIVLGSIAAFLHEDLSHVVGYSIVADAGVALLGLAVLDATAWEPTRVWLLAFCLGKTSFAAWVAIVRWTYGTRRLAELGGWARRTPTLGLAFAAIAIAGLGAPGMAVFDARAGLISGALITPLAVVLFVGSFASILYYGRILAVGLAPTSPAVAAGPDPRPIWPAGRPERLSVKLADDVLVGLQANRAPLAAAAVLALSGIALAVAGGGLGVRAAAAENAPIVEAPGGGGPVASPAPGASSAPGASGAPGSSSAPGASGAPSFGPLPTE